MGDDETATTEAVARRVWTCYAASDLGTPTQWLPIAGGFSGAQIWRIQVPHRDFCLRRWPREYPDADRLQFIHHVLRHAVAHGVTELAAPLPDRSGHTFVRADGAFWELQHWMPGNANYEHAPSPRKLAAAMRFLARFHVAMGSYAPARIQHPPGIVARDEQLRQLLHRGLHPLREALHPNVWPDLFPLVKQLLDDIPRCASGIQLALEAGRQWVVPIQPCVRDIWHDHMLFTDDQVTGVIDFGALKDDHVACDISRLLGSLVRDDRAGWVAGLEAYESIRPLSTVDQQLVSIYDRSGVLLSAANWLRWLYLDRRAFSDINGVQKRLVFLRSRMLALQN